MEDFWALLLSKLLAPFVGTFEGHQGRIKEGCFAVVILAVLVFVAYCRTRGA